MAPIRTWSPPFAQRRSLTILGLLALALPLSAGLPVVHAEAAPPPTASRVTSEASCGAPAADEFACFAVRRTDTGARRAAGVPVGFGPGDLRAAYDLPDGGGAGRTIAVVDAFDDPDAEADLGVYRAQFGLPECSTDNGCFTKVDQRGGTDYPEPNADWADEISLDLDMISAIAPDAHILLVEADSAEQENFGASVDRAVALGAKYVSNSYGSYYDSLPGGGEDPSQTTDAHYDHPGVAMVAAAGDLNYGVPFPAASPM